MTLIESNRKKASFLTVLATDLQLPNLKVFHGSWADWLGTTLRRGDLAGVDCLAMRAVRLEKEHLTVLAASGLRPGGVFAYWAGPSECATDAWMMEPWAESENLERLQPIPYTLPGGRGSHRLFRWIRKGEITR